MEEDAGKLIHDPRAAHSRVDFNRTGVPLMEIVSEPDLRSPEEAGAYLRELRDIVRYIGVCDGNMEEGSFRCDANVSIRPPSQKALGTRTEVKNLNSFKHVEKALAYEIQRQQEVLLDGDAVVQETRLWDPDRGQTTSMRGKEEAHDYRYFPDPDLLPLVVDEAWIVMVKNELPELPQVRRQRFQEQYKLPPYDAQVLTADRAVADYFEACLQWCDNPKLVSNWVMGDLLGLLNEHHRTIDDSPVSNEQLGRLLVMVEKGRISGKIAKNVFTKMAQSGQDPEQIVESQGLAQVSDAGALEKIVDDVLAANPNEVAAYQGGKPKLIGFFVGQVMRATRGKANPKVVNELLAQKLAP
jgi:aspartyl-tRNA(Asn)/glutamyl-tRNA(Gln) amidotransferase subunit B